MTLPNSFDKTISDKLVQRINQLQPGTHPLWGKMTLPQMLAHCSVAYEMVYEDKHPKPNPFMRLVLKAFVKKIVTTDKPYKKSSPTAPAFLIKEDKDLVTERARLISYINKTQSLGEAYFDNRPSLSFGPLSKDEWNNMFYKHLDHHLKQFGV